MGGGAGSESCERQDGTWVIKSEKNLQRCKIFLPWIITLYACKYLSPLDFEMNSETIKNATI